MILDKGSRKKLSAALKQFCVDVPKILQKKTSKTYEENVAAKFETRDVIEILKRVKKILASSTTMHSLPEELERLVDFNDEEEYERRGNARVPVSPEAHRQAMRQAERDADFSSFSAGLF